MVGARMGFLSIFSVDDAEPHEPVRLERRSGERFVTVMKVGRAIVGDRDRLCIIRNFSSRGLKIDLPGIDAQTSGRVTIELRTDRVMHGVVRWSRDHASGIELDEPIHADAVLDNRLSSPLLRNKPRPPRFLRSAPARIRIEGVYHDTTISDVSVQGACVEGPPFARVGSHVVVHIDGLPARSARVIWAGPQRSGVHFERVMPIADLAMWLETH